MTSNDDRTGSTPGEQSGDRAHPAVPVDQQPTTELPDGAGQQGVRAEGSTSDGPADVSADDSPVEHASVGSSPRRSRWARARGAIRTPNTHRGRVVLASAAAVALLLIGGGVGAAIGAEAGHGGGDRGGSSEGADGGRGGDRGGEGGGGRDDGRDQKTDDQSNDTTQESDTSQESTNPTSGSSDSTTSGSTTTSAPTTGN